MLKRAESNEAAIHRGCQAGLTHTPAPQLCGPCDSEIDHRISTHYCRVALHNKMNSFKPLPTHWCLPQITEDSRRVQRGAGEGLRSLPLLLPPARKKGWLYALCIFPPTLLLSAVLSPQMFPSMEHNSSHLKQHLCEA